MQEIEQYKFTWRPEENTGQIHFALADGTGASVPLDSAAEAAFLIDLLRNEKPVYFDAEHRLVATGFEPVGEGDEEE